LYLVVESQCKNSLIIIHKQQSCKLVLLWCLTEPMIRQSANIEITNDSGQKIEMIRVLIQQPPSAKDSPVIAKVGAGDGV